MLCWFLPCNNPNQSAQIYIYIYIYRLPQWLSSKECTFSTGDARDVGLWVGKVAWRRNWHPTPVFLPGKSHGQWAMGSQRVRHHWSTWVPMICIHTHSLVSLSPCHRTHAPRPPPQVITKCWAGLPVLYCNFPLVICFTHDRVYILMLLSQFILPFPSCTVSTRPATGVYSCPGERFNTHTDDKREWEWGWTGWRGVFSWNHTPKINDT